MGEYMYSYHTPTKHVQMPSFLLASKKNYIRNYHLNIDIVINFSKTLNESTNPE